MHRRDAIKKVTIGLGYAAVTPTILNLLSSCTDKTESWTPLFFSSEEKHMVTHLVDIIIPASEVPGAIDVNVPQFIDLIYNDIKSGDEKSMFKDGAVVFSNAFSTTFNKETSKGKKEEFEQLLGSYFNLSAEDSKSILKQQKEAIEAISKEDVKNYVVYKFLLSIRYYSIFGYTTSEKIGKEVLAYDPVPGSYKGCITIDEATKGRAWSTL